MVIPIIGSICLGIVVGWLVRYFIRRFNRFDSKTLGSLFTIVFGGAAVKLLGGDQTVFWYYPIGILLGFVIYSVVARIATKKGWPDDGVAYCRVSPWPLYISIAAIIVSMILAILHFVFKVF